MPRVVPSDADGMLGGLDGVCLERAAHTIDTTPMLPCAERPAIELARWVTQ